MFKSLCQIKIQICKFCVCEVNKQFFTRQLMGKRVLYFLVIWKESVFGIKNKEYWECFNLF